MDLDTTPSSPMRCWHALPVAIPLSGWLYSSATGVQVVYVGLLPLPDLVPKDKAMADLLRGVLLTLNFTYWRWSVSMARWLSSTILSIAMQC